MSTASVPTFAVVGHPNKGKSSIVSTLAEDGTVHISDEAGTTVQSRIYPMQVDGDVIYRLVDTPGFQRARTVLQWLNAQAVTADGRPGAVAKFLESHRNDERFVDECELLTPIVEGAGIVYVVDGSVPYGPEYEAEMEILRWTGQPSMAIINTIGRDDHRAAWRSALNQFFRLVREFDAMTGEFAERIALLRAFSELEPSWRGSILAAIDTLTAGRAYQETQAAQAIADMLASMVGCTARREVGNDGDVSAVQSALESRLKSDLRAMEGKGRRAVERIYRHASLEREENVLTWLDEDLFSEAHWFLWGLNRKELLGVGVAGGAVVGGAVDAGLGGTSLMLGGMVGAVVGGAAALWGGDQLAQTQVLSLPLGGKEVVCGPVKDRNFPYVALARAITHWRLVGGRSHADRSTLKVADGAGFDWSERTSTLERAQLERTFTRLRRAPDDTKSIEALVAYVRRLGPGE